MHTKKMRKKKRKHFQDFIFQSRIPFSCESRYDSQLLFNDAEKNINFRDKRIIGIMNPPTEGI